LILMDEQSGARAQATCDARWRHAHVRVAPQQLVSNSQNPPFIEHGPLIFVSHCSN
jgi:hypothetical protein